MENKTRIKLLNALTEHDRREARGKRYNPYALPQYIQALDRCIKLEEKHKDLRLCLLNCFNGRLLDKLLKAVDLPISSKEEQMVGGYRQLSEDTSY